MDPGISRKQVEEYYDSFRQYQKVLGVNIRHRTIHRNLLALGLHRNSNVLEVGCGIGTVSSLILKTVTRGKFTGVDISPGSIELARRLTARHPNAEFIVNDMSSFTHAVKFDVVVLPDVLEHIPVEQHFNLFKVLNEVTNNKAVILINIPEPHALEWMRQHHPEKLQIIDQSLDLGKLVGDVCMNGFELDSVTPYCLYATEPDYVSMVFKRPAARASHVLKGRLKLGIENLLSRFV